MWKKIAKFRAVSLMCLAGFVLVIAGVFWAYFALRNINGSLIVHYNDIQAINQIGGVWDILKVGALGTIMVVLDFFLALELEEHDKSLGKIVAAVCILVGILIFIGFAAIIAVN